MLKGEGLQPVTLANYHLIVAQNPLNLVKAYNLLINLSRA
jgi:hypothetical protein